MSDTPDTPGPVSPPRHARRRDAPVVPRLLHVRHHRPRPPRRPRRPQTRPPPHPLRHAGDAATPVQQEVHARAAKSRRPRHGQLSPSRRLRHLRHHGPPGPALQPPRTPSSTARETSAPSTATPPPAMRYTESRHRPASAASLLADIDSDTVDFVPNYDESTSQEPSRPPRPLSPTCIVNGSSTASPSAWPPTSPPTTSARVVSAAIVLIKAPTTPASPKSS